MVGILHGITIMRCRAEFLRKIHHADKGLRRGSSKGLPPEASILHPFAKPSMPSGIPDVTAAAAQMFIPGIWWTGFKMNLFGSEVQILQRYP